MFPNADDISNIIKAGIIWLCVRSTLQYQVSKVKLKFLTGTDRLLTEHIRTSRNHKISNNQKYNNFILSPVRISEIS